MLSLMLKYNSLKAVETMTPPKENKSTPTKELGDKKNIPILPTTANQYNLQQLWES
jgi:hypothetical protein